MLYSNFMVMSFPFITMVEHNEKKKRKNALELENNLSTVVADKSINTNIDNKNIKPSSKKCNKEHNKNEYKDMVILSNLDEVVFQTSSSKCLMDELFPKQKNKKEINYDKYLDFFE